MKCIMCGEKDAITTVPNPNGEAGMWDVCGDCEDFIVRGQSLAMECMLKDMIAKHTGSPRPDHQKLAKKWMEDENPQFDKVGGQ